MDSQFKLQQEISTRFNAGCKIFFTSDTHFSHHNIIKYCDRPFDNSQEMNSTMVNNWNAVVGERDIVFHLGDWGMSNVNLDVLRSILQSLRGDIITIRGNHDPKRVCALLQKHCLAVEWQLSLQLPKTPCLVMNHIPFLWPAQSRSGRINLHGHTHCKTPIVKNLLQINVGVDAWNFTPVELPSLLELIKKQRLTYRVSR